MGKVLHIVFAMEDGKTHNQSLQDPKDGLTYNDVSAFSDVVVAKDAIIVDEISTTGLDSAYIEETRRIELQ